MARTNLPVTPINRGGVAAAAENAGDAVNGNSVANTNGNVILLAHNTDTSSHNLTVNFTETVDGQTVTARVTAVPASGSMYFGPFPVGEYGQTLSVNVDSALLKLTAYMVTV